MRSAHVKLVWHDRILARQVEQLCKSVQYDTMICSLLYGLHAAGLNYIRKNLQKRRDEVALGKLQVYADADQSVKQVSLLNIVPVVSVVAFPTTSLPY